MKTWLFIFVGVFLLCAGSPAGAETVEKLNVWASLPPLAWLSGQVGGERLVVQTFLKPGQDPHIFSPTPRDIMRVKEADLFVHAGSPFEHALAKKLNAMFKGMDVKQLWESQANGHHEHGEACAFDHHGHGQETQNSDPHVWFSLRNLETMADRLVRALISLDPKGEAVYKKNLEALKKRLAAADADFSRNLAAFKGKAFYVHHPAFGHFAADYGLVQKAVEIEGKDPSPRQLLAVIKSAREDGVKTIVASPQFADRPSRILAERIGGKVVKIDPLSADPLDAMSQLVKTIAGQHK